jgi:hypothetical protein
MKPLPEELTAKIDEIKSWLLVPGDQDKVAAKSRKCREYVNKVLNKKAFNAEVIAAGVEVMNENKRLFEIKPTMKIA